MARRRLGNHVPVLYDMQGFPRRMPACFQHPETFPNLVLVGDQVEVYVHSAVAFRHAAQLEE